jgi:arylsulfatase A-like enzyme
MKTPQSILIALAVAGITAATDFSLAAPPKPNFIVIVADDLGWADLGFQGSRISTPHLDQLAAEGLRLDQHYVFPVCSPTRAALLSGRYAGRFGCTMPTNNRVFPFDTVTLAAALQSVGYRTALVGKWHLGSKAEWGPNHFGFDQSYGLLAGGCGSYCHRYQAGPFSQTWHRDGQLIEETGHVTDLITREAVRFIETHRDRPFFLYLPYTAPHIPLDEPEPWLEANRHIADPGKRLYGAGVTHLDDGIGQVVAALQRLQLDRNTLLVFFSDNGAHGSDRNDRRATSVGPLAPRVRVANPPALGALIG